MKNKKVLFYVITMLIFFGLFSHDANALNFNESDGGKTTLYKKTVCEYVNKTDSEKEATLQREIAVSSSVLNKINNSILFSDSNYWYSDQSKFREGQNLSEKDNTYYVYFKYLYNTDCPVSIFGSSNEGTVYVFSDEAKGDYILKTFVEKTLPLPQFTCNYVSIKDSGNVYLSVQMTNSKSKSLVPVWAIPVEDGRVYGAVKGDAYQYSLIASLSAPGDVAGSSLDKTVQPIKYNNYTAVKSLSAGMYDYEYLLSGKCPTYAHLSKDSDKSDEYEIALSNSKSVSGTINFGKEYDIYEYLMSTEESEQQKKEVAESVSAVLAAVNSSRVCLQNNVARESCKDAIDNASNKAADLVFLCSDIVESDQIPSEDSRKTSCNSFLTSYDKWLAEGVIESRSSGCGLLSRETRTWLFGALTVIKIAAVIALVVLSMLDFTKAAASPDADSMKKIYKKTMYRFIAAVIIFLLPSLVEFIVNNMYKFGLGGIDNNNPLCR